MDNKRLVEGFLKGKTEITITEIFTVENLIELIGILTTYQYKWNDGDQFCLKTSMYSNEYSDDFTYILNSQCPFRITYSEYGDHCGIVIPCMEFLKITKTIKFYLNNWKGVRIHE